MKLQPSTRTSIVLILAILGVVALYAGPVTTRFLNDDYLFLEQARTRPFIESLTELAPLGNYYRPLSRQAYFAVLTPLAGDQPLVFHLVNAALFLAALALLADLLASMLPVTCVVAGVLYFALLPFQRVNLMWVSCSQDLMALAGTLAAVALWRRGRQGMALVPAALAFASKESALPLPAALAAYEVWVARRASGGAAGAAAASGADALGARMRAALRRVAPMSALALAWVALSAIMRARGGAAAAAPLALDPGSFAAAYAHLAQSLVGLEDPAGWWDAMRTHAPSLVPLLLLAPLAFWAESRSTLAPTGGAATSGAARPARAAREPAGAPAVHPRDVLAFGAAWLVAFGFVVGPVAASWSAYYFTLAGVGGAVVVAALMRHARALGMLGLMFAMLWVHAGANGTRAFSVARSPWTWTSHLTSFYFERAAAITDSLSRDLKRLEPHPDPEARLFFAMLPEYAGFQMGNGALVRSLYRAPRIESHFYSQFSESTAAHHPALFFYWDGETLRPLYAKAEDPLLQVGTDMIVLGRLDGAAHAFRRGLATGGLAKDHLYWLGWTELWRGHRDAAESLWARYGARDDSLQWLAQMGAAYQALRVGDTLQSRRHLITAISYGIGRPEAHDILGGLLVGKHPKFGLLELEVANRLDPTNVAARRARVLGLEQLLLADRARQELEVLMRQYPEWRSDSAVAAAAARLQRRPASGAGVVRF